MRYLRFLLILILVLLPLTQVSAKREWKAMRQFGAIYIIYVEPESIGKKEVLARIISYQSALMGDERPFQLDFFDSERHIPHALKYTAKNTLHHRARYNFNPANGLKRFGWMVPIDPDNPIAGRRFVEEPIKLPEPEEPESALDSNPEDW